MRIGYLAFENIIQVPGLALLNLINYLTFQSSSQMMGLVPQISTRFLPRRRIRSEFQRK